MSNTGSLTKYQQEQINNLSAFFGSLDKLVRGFQLYEGKGALVERLLQDAFSKASKALDDVVTVRITPVGPMLYGEALLGEGQTPKYLFQLFCDGVRELTFHPGITLEEMDGFVDVFLTDYQDSEDDMVTALWKKDIRSIRYYAVDTLGVQVNESDADLSVQESEQLMSSEGEGEDMTLSASDIRLLKAQDSLGWVRRCKAPSSSEDSELSEKLAGHLIDEGHWKRFVAIALSVEGNTQPMIINMVESLLVQNQSKELIEILDSIADLAAQEIDTASSLLSSVLSKEMLSDLAPAFVEDSKSFMTAFERALSLDGYEPEGLVELLKSLPIGSAREDLQNLLIQHGIDMTPFYLESLQNEDSQIVVSALQALGKIGSNAALVAISKSLTHSLAEVRFQALKSLDGRYTAEARGGLVKALNDTEENIRLTALQILADSGDRMIGSSILGVAQSADFSKKGFEEQEAVIFALSKFPTTRIIGFFSDILNEKNLTRNKKIVSKQKFVIGALAKMESPDANNLLLQASKSWFLPSDLKLEARNAAKVER
ncbi:MAG: hypothetical protein CMK59_12110 [Proteobacteria bacterium]|nr:hypothetical protein [Pseudomonadota bacterium]